MRNFLIICAIALGFTACEKPAGEGGTSVIEGQVYKIYTSEIVVNELDSFGNIDTTYKSIDTLYYQLDEGEDVYIIYDDNEGELYDDKFKTDYNGKYHFEYFLDIFQMVKKLSGQLMFKIKDGRNLVGQIFFYMILKQAQLKILHSKVETITLTFQQMVIKLQWFHFLRTEMHC